MVKKIAVYVGFTGHTVSFTEPGNLVLYVKHKGVWRLEKQMAFALEQYQGLGQIRQQINEIVTFLGDCTIFVAKIISGAPYYQLEKAGCSVWEYTGKPFDFLDFILEREEAVELEADTMPVVPQPVHLGNGIYRINIKPVQELDLGVTTKQVLLPFLQRNSYYQLEIICNHLPPWLEAEMLFNKLTYQYDKHVPGELHLTITKQVCSEA